VIARATSVIGNAIADGYPLGRGLRWIERAHRQAEASEDYATLSGIAVRLATAYLETGRWRAAEQMAASAMHVDASLHRIRALRRSRAVMSLLHALQGVTDPLDSRLDGTYVGNERFGGPAISIPDLVARFEHQLLTSALDHAVTTIEKAHAVLAETPGWERSLVLDVLPRMHLVYARLGDEARVRSTLDEFEAVAARVDGLRVAEPLLLHARSRLRAHTGSWHLALDLAVRAAAGFHALDYRWRGALARLDAGEYATRAGDRPAAVTALEAAYRDLDAMRAVNERDRARTLLLELGHRAPTGQRRGSGLTPRELQIAQLVNEGLTDADIADRLSVSRRTVTTHVHNLLSKLGLRSRLEVPYDPTAPRTASSVGGPRRRRPRGNNGPMP
jgi:DNA-binding CsgD family transcriptional regulator